MHPLSKCRSAEKFDLPIIDHPGNTVGAQIVHPHFQILRLETGTVLKIIDQGLCGQSAILPCLTVTDPTFKCIHVTLHFSGAKRLRLKQQ